MRLPLNQVGSLNKINRTLARLEQEFERVPSAGEVADYLEISEEKVSDTMKISGRHVSVDAPFKEGEDHGLLDVLSNDASPKTDALIMRESLLKEIDRSLQTLGERESQVVKLFYGIGMQHALTLDEIGDKFELTRERVRQVKEKAIKKLRQNSRSKLLRSYLG